MSDVVDPVQPVPGSAGPPAASQAPAGLRIPPWASLDAGARMVVLNAKLGQAAGPDAYIVSTDANIAALAAALR